MAGEKRCPDCGRALASREVITKGWHRDPESCGSRLHPCWAEECAGRTIIRLRAQLAAARALIDAQTALLVGRHTADGRYAELVNAVDRARRALEELGKS